MCKNYPKKIETDYYKEIGTQKPAILKHQLCPKCNSELGAIHPDRVWCTNKECNYAQLHLVGKGTRELVFKDSSG